MRRVAVLGAGSWGTAFAAVLADAGNEVRLWARRPELAREVQEARVNMAYLPNNVVSCHDPAKNSIKTRKPRAYVCIDCRHHSWLMWLMVPLLTRDPLGARLRMRPVLTLRQ